MSHFTVIAITRQTSLDGFDAEAEIEKLLEPFNEHTRTAPYPDTCLCTEIEGIAVQSGLDYGAKGEPLLTCDECKGLGTVLSTYNPASKWDWYEIGGRWEGELPDNIFQLKDLPADFTTHAFITPHWEWKQKGRMGWWATVTEENDNYQQEWKDARKLYGDNVAVLLDCHI